MSWAGSKYLRGYCSQSHFLWDPVRTGTFPYLLQKSGSGLGGVKGRVGQCPRAKSYNLVHLMLHISARRSQIQIECRPMYVERGHILGKEREGKVKEKKGKTKEGKAKENERKGK